MPMHNSTAAQKMIEACYQMVIKSQRASLIHRIIGG